MASFNVRLNGKLIDTVFFTDATTAEEAKKLLVDSGEHKPEIKVTRRTVQEFIVQGNYGYGWDDESTEDNEKEAKVRLKEYQLNGSGSYRLIKRRVKV
jgi:hypothetical protein